MSDYACPQHVVGHTLGEWPRAQVGCGLVYCCVFALQEKENECVSLQKNASEHKVQGAAHEAAHRSKCLFIFKRQFSTIYHLGVGGGGVYTCTLYIHQYGTYKVWHNLLIFI